MQTTDTQRLLKTIEDYNNDCEAAIAKSLSYGSLKTSKATLAELAGLAANDNQKQEG